VSTERRSREIHLASRPDGWPTPDNFSLVEVGVPQLADGQVLVRNTAMSVDPYMRPRMDDVASYLPPFQVGIVLDGGAAGEVVASRSPERQVGDVVVHALGWREFAVLDAKATKPIDTSLAPTSAFLGALGMTGLTAYAGLTAVAELKEGDTVFVSGAAGAVGSLVGQIARLLGAKRVIGSVGSPEKVARLLELGFDAAFDYNGGSVTDKLAEAAPEGIDVYFDNVGGDHLEAALAAMNPGGRIALCGAIAQYNSTQPSAAPRNLAAAIGKGLTLRGFLVGSYQHLAPEFTERMATWLAHDQIRFQETTVEGLENAPAAFLGMLRGKNIGKMVVSLA
jgi:hypothetical protein